MTAPLSPRPKDPAKPGTTAPRDRAGGRDFSVLQLLPNMLTVAAICAGLSALRFAVQGSPMLAVILIVVACILDGLDGRIARMLNSDSQMGAELDSLADFLNFGVIPPLVLYMWALQDTAGIAWMAVLFYAVCCVLRLARFNVASKADKEAGGDGPPAYFTGIPSPAGALLVLLPLTFSFAFPALPRMPDLVICAFMVAVGLLMISRVPTWSFKAARVSRGNVKFFLLAFACAVTAILTYAWITLVVLCIGYIVMVLWSLLTRATSQPNKDT